MNFKLARVDLVTQTLVFLSLDLVDVCLVSQVPLDLLVDASAFGIEVIFDLLHVSILDVYLVIKLFDLLLQVNYVVINEGIFGT